ncbi:hypothetical protein LR48_Vigan350s000400 [Vigna angularis]|uniref:Putative plant transposon protein domain-containing protein n=1 Tax=Phaseolus angularis TaxID=3914 RepID=A0A0L9TA69_PHAAN|nr:hypothetical protein LR48_Vigan350s000400 [Vigna angularis]
MASSSGKRYKTIGSKRKDKEPECTHSSKFLSRKHEKHFKIVQDRRLLMERKAGLIPELAPQFGEQMVSRNWRRLATYPTPANIAVMKEFYTNARRLGDHPAEDYLSFVRGHAIQYDPDSINRFLDTEWVGEQCQFVLNMEEGTNFDDVMVHKLCEQMHDVVIVIMMLSRMCIIKYKTPEKVYELIENMATNDNEMHNERGAPSQQKRVLQLQSHDALFAQNKIITQQLENLAQEDVNYMGNQFRQGNFNQGWKPDGSTKKPYGVAEDVVVCIDKLKLGAPVRFKGIVWVVKELKDNGVIEIEASYSKRVKKVTKKMLMSWRGKRRTST